MPLIITPRHLSQRSELYHQLGSLVAAGVSLIQGLEMVSRTRLAHSLKRPLSLLVERLNSGSTFGEALESLGTWLPAFDIAMMQAAEKSGRLDAAFHLLSDYYNERARLARSVISDMLYPIVTLHVAVLVFPPDLLRQLVWEGNVTGFLWQKASVLVPLYAAVVLVSYACQGRHGEWWRSIVELVIRPVPVLGTARRNLALARLSAALEGLLSAGVSIVDAWELAAASSGSPALHRSVRQWRPGIDAGQTPGELVRESSAFPDLFGSLYCTGELSGQLDDTLRRLYRHYQEEGSRKLKAVAQWMPRFLYFGLLLALAFQVVSFWTNYYSGVMKALE